jgi:DNA polymerase
MAYYHPEYGESRYTKGKMTISYMGIEQKTRKWARIETWGGRIFENLVQATARDCLRDTMMRLDDEGWDIRGHVHDEIICTEPYGGRSVEDMCEVFARPIEWAPGLPLSGAGYETPFYKKDD